ncbi:MAG: TonB-dependent receptor plug domain-containing protein, partial [Flavobacteriales bacterium]|nr:TonB-dependent receptor plug domain-containing protein [Flavobacteriales bacterium]
MGQTGRCDLRISGRVIDEHDRSALRYATVQVVGTDKGVVCDEAGAYALDGLCPGRITLRVAHVGCETMDRVVELRANTELDLFLEHHVEELRQFEVVRQRPDEHVGQAHDEVDKDAMERSSGRTLGEMIAVIPGVTALNSGPTISKPMVHGLTGNRVLLLNQGIRQEDQQWGSEHAPNLDPFSSDRITVVKGAASVQYGSDAIGGVVITEPVELPREGPMSGEVRGLGMLNGLGYGGNALLQGGVKDVRGLGWRVQGSGRSMGDSRAANYVLSNTGMHETGASASIGYRDHRWSASVYGS